MTISSTPLVPARWTRSVEQRDQALAAFQRKALLADIAGVQIALDALGRGQLLQNPQLFFGAHLPIGYRLFEAGLEPGPLLAGGDVDQLGADGAAIDLLEALDDLAQRHGRAAFDAGHCETRVVILRGQTVAGRIQFLWRLRPHQAQRIQVRELVPTHAIGLE